MVKLKQQFVCQQCGAVSHKWAGRCENCGSWNSLIEQAAPSGSHAVAKSTGKKLAAMPISEVSTETVSNRTNTGIQELDMVLGGGLMPGGVVLIAGEPGIGKSTLIMQVAGTIGAQLPTLYVSGEESINQVRLRADRLAAISPKLDLSSSNSADDIASTIKSGDYKLVIVDSMQTIAMAELTSAPGTVSQITNSANLIIQAAKATHTTVILVGHVTKEGSIAGPKILEHAVDVVLSLEGDRYEGFKIIRAAKNRYGSTSEVALLEMTDKGLKGVKNPSAALLEERQNTDGSIVLATLEGNRPLLVEIQALVNKSHFGYPKRTASGFDINRLNVLIAVLERRTKLQLSDSDIYINVVGGLKLQDPAADLAIVMAIASAAAGRKLDTDVVVFGEVGLSGEIRSVTSTERRISEAKKLGFKYAIAPATRPKNNFIQPISNLRDALNTYLKK
jgi:DNA repair protein RadA/Sms